MKRLAWMLRKQSIVEAIKASPEAARLSLKTVKSRVDNILRHF